MDIALVLRRARLRAGLSQAQLAAQAGTSQATVSAYESGRKQPSVATLDRLLGATGCRLTVAPARRSGRERTREPDAARLNRAGKTFVDVLALAQALPVRHQPTLGYPRIGRPPNRPA